MDEATRPVLVGPGLLADWRTEIDSDFPGILATLTKNAKTRSQKRRACIGQKQMLLSVGILIKITKSCQTCSFLFRQLPADLYY